MSTFTVVIKTDNVAYEGGDFYDEIIANLKSVIQQVDTQEQRGIIRDSNGNRVEQRGIIRDSNGNRVGKFYYESGE